MLPGAATDRLLLCFSRKIVPVARQVWRVFLQSGYKFYAYDECRGKSSGGKREVVQLYKSEERPVEQRRRRLLVSKPENSPVAKN